MLESEQGPETCNTYNMLRLTKELWKTSGHKEYMDFYERALYNHILSSQHPEGGFVYFTPIRPMHYRVYSQPHQGMWCCVGSGMENHGKYGELIYAHRGDDILVNLFVASTLDWSDQGIMLDQKTGFPNKPGSEISLRLGQPKSFKMLVRIPGWIPSHKLLAEINDEGSREFPTENGYAIIERTWVDGDRIAIQLPMEISTEPLPGQTKWMSFLYGPILLAARTDTTQLVGIRADDSRMGHVAKGKKFPLESAPELLGTPGILSEKIQSGKQDELLVFRLEEVISPVSYRKLNLVPFYEVHDTRYIVYWPTSDSTVKK
jgi:DUF1680 family protein